MNLFLVRHGETKENEAGILMGHHHGILTDKGKQQARETAELLKGHKLSHIYSSDLARCVDTAEFIKEFHPDTPLTFTKELRERNLGALQGQPATSVDWDGLPGEGDDKKPENGESIAELKVRALAFIETLYKQHSTESILLVSHNGWIKQVISHYTGVHSKDIEKVGNAQVIEVEVGENLTGKLIS
jgi:broad specificity phosphatase PhoE